MPLKIFKNLIAISWIATVIFFYFKNHSYYQSGWDEIGKWLILLLLIPGIFAFFALNKWFETKKTEIALKITFPRILATIVLLILIVGNTIFLVRDPAFYSGNDLIYTDNQVIEITDDQTIEGEEVLVVTHQSGIDNAKENLAWIPFKFHENFTFPTFLEIQIGLIVKSLGILLSLGLITLISIALGFVILKKSLGKNTKFNPDNIIISLGLGISSIIVLTFILGAFNLLNIYSTWILFAILGVISGKTIIELIKSLFTYKKVIKVKPLNINLLIILILVLAITVNFIDNISVVPRGWDGLNQYMNIAAKIKEEGGLITIGGNYYWELFMSLGLIMFNWTAIAINLASFLPALLASIAIYFILRKFSSKKSALFVTTAIYLTPLFLYHGVEDNKVDLGNLLISSIAFLSICKGIFSKTEKIPYIAIGGLLLGITLGIKLTSLIFILAILSLILFKYYRWIGLTTGLLAGIGLFFLASEVHFGADFDLQKTTELKIGAGLIAASIITFLITIIKTKKLSGLKIATIFCIFVGITFSPWLIKNFSESHSLTPYGLFFGDHPQPTIDHQLLETDYNLDSTVCEGTGSFEELDRYLGYASLPMRYITLPWHMTMNNQEVKGIYVDIGFLFLALIPALILFIGRKQKKEWTYIIITGVSFLIFWLVAGFGIIWYALPGFVLLGTITAGLIDNYEKKNKQGKYLINIVILILLISSIVFRFGSAGKVNQLLYISDTITEEQSITATFPTGLEVYNYFEENKEGLIWKIGTSLNYFIKDNFWRTYNDQYLDDLNCLYNERNPELLTERLKALGFSYIIFDYYTYELGTDPESNLEKKYTSALDYVLNHTDIVISDPYRGYLISKIK